MRTRFTILLFLFGILAALHSSLNPLFESSDEFWHIGMAVHLARGGGLPVQQPGVQTMWRQEGSQPPLYYGLLAWLTRLLGGDLSDFERIYLPNPHAHPGDAALISNRNQILHGPWEAFPWRGSVLTLHLWRGVSILLAAAGVAFTIGWIRWLFPQHPRWAVGVGLLVALNPMFLFIAGSVNNDVAVNSLAPMVLYFIARIWRLGLRWKDVIMLGVGLGAAALAKLSGLLLWPVAGAALLIRTLRERRARSQWWALPLPFTIAALISGWWFFRNWQLYGDPTGLSMMLAIAGRRSATMGDLIREWEGFRRSFWGVFGGMNVVMPSWIYTALDLWASLAGLGFLAFLLFSPAMRRPENRWLWVGLLGYIALVFAGVVRWTSMTMASQGRLMFTALGPIALSLWVGWEHWTRRIPFRSLRWLAWAFPPAFLGTLALAAPVLWIAPAYQPPPAPTPEELAALPVRLDTAFGGKIRLIGLDAKPHRLQPGQAMDVWLYFETLGPTETDWSLFVHLLDDLDIIIAQHDGYPLQGLSSTRLLQPGQRWKEHVRLQIPRAAVAPSSLALAIGFYDLRTGQRFPADHEGKLMGDHIRLPIGRLEPGRGEVPNPIEYRFGGAIELIG
ncbi:MAG TPA: DUF2142 domain-containing protein, partial [Thermoflexus sp.]|nr:DUF2142 domain-containing protein [Thermoflexus sp.]